MSSRGTNGKNCNERRRDRTPATMKPYDDVALWALARALGSLTALLLGLGLVFDMHGRVMLVLALMLLAGYAVAALRVAQRCVQRMRRAARKK